jgi:UPF0042 nucleotide-binding protein
MRLRLTSFGFLHLPTGLDGRPVPPRADPRVQDVVLNTPGARELLDNLVEYACLPAGPQHIAIGCAGGRHRASSLTELLATRLRERGLETQVEHLHVHLPRVLKAPNG